ncbi:50S ribosomal protein L4 [Candidatus Saccharibacteria bacterium]|nr:50S ribosomal protein L4 [Candidatus Saccharibacteria bacterium]
MGHEQVTVKNLKVAIVDLELNVIGFTRSGNKATAAAKLNKAVFGVLPANHELLKAAYVAYLANGRGNLAQTKTRGLVRGGGRKPWRQKGTGRARFGSSRNPIWRGGGIVFGPTGQENYAHKLPASARQQAIRQALSLAVDSGKVLIIETLQLKDAKTATAAALLTKIGAIGNVLLVVDDKLAELERALRNLPNAILVQARYVNVYDVLNADQVVITSPALAVLSGWLGGKAS